MAKSGWDGIIASPAAGLTQKAPVSSEKSEPQSDGRHIWLAKPLQRPDVKDNDAPTHSTELLG